MITGLYNYKLTLDRTNGKRETFEGTVQVRNGVTDPLNRVKIGPGDSFTFELGEEYVYKEPVYATFEEELAKDNLWYRSDIVALLKKHKLPSSQMEADSSQVRWYPSEVIRFLEKYHILNPDRHKSISPFVAIDDPDYAHLYGAQEKQDADD